MEALSINQKENTIQWKQLWSLAALYGSIVIGWIAYQRYQPKLLVQFHFTDFTLLLVIAQGLILTITPPIAGKLGDRYRFEKGHRIPVITAGISFAAMIFMAVAFTLFSNPNELFKWVLPVLIVFWLIAMSIFTSPALSTMELFTPVDKLPRAMAVLTIVANLIYALEPVIVDIIDFLGAPVTFMTGGIVVFISGYALRKNSLSLFSQQNNKEDRPIAAIAFDTQRSRLVYIFFLGIVLGIATTVLFNIFPDVLQAKIGPLMKTWNGKILVVDILVVSAIVSWPLSNLVNRVGMERSFWISTVLIVVSMVSILLLQATALVLIMTLVFALMFATLSVSSLPLAIKNSNYYEKVFCVGIFFSGVAFPDGMVETLQAMQIL
ncbi:MAG TPA: MFS transporter [Ohtaekwangia sp.]|uniref:MFS transporter n=1 Tax=Ohtaekwangia sp. TaxID=2066019 RepID=UPI002F93A13C